MNDALTSPTDEENPWKQALEGTGVGVWDWNLVTNAQTHSARWEEMLGYQAGELTQGYRDFVDRVHPDDLPRVQTDARNYMAGLVPTYAQDIRIRCKDGSWKWILARGTVVERDANGAPLRMIGTHTDITERKRAESDLRALNTQLQQNTQLLQTTLSSISQGIVLVDADGRVRQFNQRACELLDLPMSMLAQHPLMEDIIHFLRERGDFGTDAHLVAPEARQHLTQSTQWATNNYPSHYLRDTPQGRTLEVRTQNLPSGGLVRTFADVTDYVQSEAARQRLNTLLDATQTVAGVGAWERDFINNTVYWTDGVYRILEVTPEDYTPGDLAST